MKYLVVKLGDVSVGEDIDSEFSLDMDEYLRFVQMAKEKGVIETILKVVNFGCVKCKSFTIPPVQLYDAIRIVNDDFEFEGIEELAGRLIEHVSLTDEEWSRYWNRGQDSVEIIKGAKIIEIEGEMYRFQPEEVFFQFDDTCECSKIIKDVSIW